MAIKCDCCGYDFPAVDVEIGRPETPLLKVPLIKWSVVGSIAFLIIGSAIGSRQIDSSNVIFNLFFTHLFGWLFYWFFLKDFLSGYADLRKRSGFAAFGGPPINKVHTREKSPVDFWIATISPLLGAVGFWGWGMLVCCGIVDH